MIAPSEVTLDELDLLVTAAAAFGVFHDDGSEFFTKLLATLDRIKPEAAV